MLRNKGIIYSFLNENRFKIFILISLLIFGCILGIIVANSIDNNMKVQLIEYIDANNKIVVQENYVVDNYSIMKTTLINVLVYIGTILILGCSIIFSPLIYLAIVHKGFSIGFCISFLIMLLGNVKGSIYALISILVPNLILIIGIIYISILWINFARNILKNRNLYGIKNKIYSCLIITGIACVILLGVLIPIELFTNNVLDNYIRII